MHVILYITQTLSQRLYNATNDEKTLQQVGSAVISLDYEAAMWNDLPSRAAAVPTTAEMRSRFRK